MPRRFFKRYLPDQRNIKSNKFLNLFGNLLHDPNLWHLNRYSVAGGVSVGLFVAFVPIPFQMLLAAAVAIPLRANIPISASLVWITNPITLPPLFFAAYKVGAALLDIPPEPFHFELSWQWLSTGFLIYWQPFLLGCFILGTASAAIGNVSVRIFWRLQVVKNWHKRKKRRKKS